MELGRRGPEGQGDVAAEAVLPPEAGGEEHPVHGERIGVALPVHPVPGTAPGADQRRTLIAPARRVQPVLDRRVVEGHGPAQGGEGFPHGRGIGDRPPGAMLGEPAPNRSRFGARRPAGPQVPQPVPVPKSRTSRNDQSVPNRRPDFAHLPRR